MDPVRTPWAERWLDLNLDLDGRAAKVPRMNIDIFEDLFVLELANNHWGKVERGLKIVADFAKIVRFNNVRAAIKLQFRDVDHLSSNEFRGCTDIEYIKKTLDTKLCKSDYARLIDAI